MKDIILIGGTKAGKTTLLKVLNGEKFKKIDIRTQSLEFEDQSIDTPGEYIENRQYYTALISAAQEAEMIGLVADATAEQYFFPPTFASIFTRPVIGIVTKIDEPKANIDHAKNILNMAGADKIFLTSALTGKGITELSDFISGK
ncbi:MULTISPECIES: EutP/PduV family microcompartment system protein [Halanaerobium]|jgi:ethanolamine utilization protein EutP|uniref:Ethanolamine utilization protein EutP n=1 Tax=Halanaerobium congolense TaxID=54121 RepID=A0A1G6L6Z6_9FIRM|nr:MULTISPECIES: EutP/PduV family microcompartment system protein [Halanaerobium]PUU87259.1 MAG: ethanolamine utilization protein EutP [Halanaerobium sp.]PUU88183.1 MAG: ethanolamine utilization protein EutP [Halanaerobium sp.]PXV64775.1 ethanolamine utilization protein EutP [Halanaerobium congolense]TDS35351.1 ethanolamine utilization protein EutP [Halanaerobium congolense]SDC38525.1 ethanolamine utilization protein EutP [Halanaerobium congolense]